MSVLLFLTVIFFLTTYTVEGQSTCKTPSGRQGQCIIVDNCPELYALIKNTNTSPRDTDLLRKSHCGYQGQKPMVCCESKPPPNNKCYTPDGQIGECVNYLSCQSIVNMLQAQSPVPSETYQFVQNSRCQGPTAYSVCCPESRAVVTPTPSVKPGKKGKCQAQTAPPDPRTECCGREASSDDRISGGNATALDQYPWLALIEYSRGTAIKLLCGGVLISGRYVLTAGHCVLGDIFKYGNPMNVRLGEYDTSTGPVDTKVVAGGGVDTSDPIVVIPIEQMIPHPEYNPKHPLRRNDIALIRMASMAPYTEFIRPICLPAMDPTRNPPAEFKLFAAGWGAVNETLSASTVKLHVDLPYKTKSECQAAYNIPRRSIQLWDKQICAGGVKGKDSCKGDSGGPLMYENGRVFEVIGIVSFGTTPCGLEDVPGVYSKVIEYITWIRNTIR